MVILVNSVGETGDIESSLILGVVSLLMSGCLEGLFPSKDSKKFKTGGQSNKGLITKMSLRGK